MPVVDTWHKILKLPDGSMKKVRSAACGRGKRWAARYRDNQGRQKSPKFATKPQAEHHLAEVQGDLARGAYVDPAAGKVLLRTFAEQWLAGTMYRPLTCSRVKSTLVNEIYPAFGERRMSSILPSEIQAWVKRLGAQRSPETVAGIYAVLRTIFAAAVRDEILAKSACRGIHLPEKRRAPSSVMPVATVGGVADAVDGRYRAAVLLCAGTGLRQGELFGLEEHHLDFEALMVRVQQQLLTPASSIPHLAEPKTTASYRDVPITPETAAMLRAHLDASPPTEQGIEDRTDPHHTHWRTARLVFTTAQNQPVRRWAWSLILAPAMRQAGMPPRSGLHTVRRFYASLLIRYGESVKTVQHRLGHASAATTLDTYAGLWPDSEDRTRDAVTQGLSGLNVRPTCAEPPHQ